MRRWARRATSSSVARSPYRGPPVPALEPRDSQTATPGEPVPEREAEGYGADEDRRHARGKVQLFRVGAGAPRRPAEWRAYAERHNLDVIRIEIV